MRSRNRAEKDWPTIRVATLLALAIFVAGAEAGLLDQIRKDVREGSSSSDRKESSEESHHYDHDDDDGEDIFWLLDIFFNDSGHGHHHDGHGAWTLLGYTLTSPFWAPPNALADQYSLECRFPRFPYDNAPGYMLIGDCWPEFNPDKFGQRMPLGPHVRRWAGRVRFEYADEFDDVARTSGHLLLSTTSRFGLDMATDYLREKLPSGGVDDLSLGDCNIVFRFAQNEFAQFRTGLGFNWLDDPIETNFGFNFTYGADFFPVKPWIVSSTIDLGTLGDAGLFRFRLTSGVVINRYEVYAGYEYLDIGSSEISSLVSGVRVWF